MRSIVPNKERDLSSIERSFALPFGPELTAERLRMTCFGKSDFSRSLP